jgi:serine O-acetyltransferase
VPPETTVAGVPAKVVGPAGCPEPARTMDQRLLPDDCGCGS